ncbi:SDR family oxidoreductase [Thermoclostridium stercorarium]|jgi:NAD(P)-dependent dehydrogenase (short-subunit alcohol dehydrogenase family)|uniref:Short-chain dehydrogenase n=1 Tax=Thermoclostridium stercorarium subsp. leptospartum DSM 9219 TaxID=1346611 RepID=A0A1B1YN42_THEST|nr:SDR family oxidoreductase [Thermoclostridium stercorarium]ANX02205.1 short-chain dehydrogenase [Thermoclostridium stercorarium subsp. leptospartum DSM 9219]UZQ85281.1 SDR family oxidoreductase [Thermoclostridium stercorarium]
MPQSGKVIIVTGASSGLGLAVANHLGNMGHNVYAGARSFKNSGPDSGNLKKMYLDVTDENSVNEFVRNVIDAEGKIDVLVNCAAMLVLGSVEDISMCEFEQVINTNLIGTVRMCKAVLPYMRERKNGLVINFSSIMGLLAIPFQCAYSASKFAIEGFSEALSLETRDFGIKVVIVEPTDHKSGSQKYRPHAKGAALETSPYRDMFLRVTEKIEYDESHGSEPEKLAEVIGRIIDSKNPKLRYKIGKFDQKLSVAAKRILPGRIFESVIRSYYNCVKK